MDNGSDTQTVHECISRQSDSVYEARLKNRVIGSCLEPQSRATLTFERQIMPLTRSYCMCDVSDTDRWNCIRKFEAHIQSREELFDAYIVCVFTSVTVDEVSLSQHQAPHNKRSCTAVLCQSVTDKKVSLQRREFSVGHISKNVSSFTR